MNMDKRFAEEFSYEPPPPEPWIAWLTDRMVFFTIGFILLGIGALAQRLFSGAMYSFFAIGILGVIVILIFTAAVLIASTVDIDDGRMD